MDSSQINLHEGIRETVPNLTHTQLAWRNSIHDCMFLGRKLIESMTSLYNVMSYGIYLLSSFYFEFITLVCVSS